MGRGKTIQIFLPDGSPSGIKLAEITSSIEKAILIPRNKLTEAANREESKQVGVYFLFGKDENNSKPLVYIGETKNGISRIKNHGQNKDFWNYALLIISKTKSFTKTHIEYLEDLTIRKAKEANRFEFENAVSPKTYNIPEHLEADLLDSFDTIKVLTTTLGFPLFESLQQNQSIKSNNFTCKGKDGLGHGYLTGEGFVVQKDSMCHKTLTKSAGNSLINLRNKLIDSKLLVLKNNTYIFSDDYLFSTPSAAANVILGRRSNGWSEWKNKSGKNLKEVYKQ